MVQDNAVQDNVALVRIEQLYPFPEKDLLTAVKCFKALKSAVWCQEEPMNQGAWYHSRHHMEHVLRQAQPQLTLGYVGREPSAAPAAGYMSVHLEEQNRFVAEALTVE